MTRVFIDSVPWRDSVDVRIAVKAGRVTQYAKGIEDAMGQPRIVWATTEDGAEVPVFLSLQRDVLEALAKALGEFVPAVDATVEALKDARGVRDRLLVLVEEGWRSA